MALSAAERSRRYRENKKKQGLYQQMKMKHREQQRKSRANRTHAKKVADRRRDALRKRQSRHAISQQLTSASDHDSSPTFVSAQTLGKAMKKVTKALPSNTPKKFEVVKRLAQSEVVNFYERDDVSWQAPGKRDTVTIKRDGKSEKIQRRHLLFNLRELHGLYQLQFPQYPISRAAFQDLRPSHVKPLSTLSQRVCVCVQHANVHLLLKALLTHVDGLNNDLHYFVKMLVCDDANEECMMRQCLTCQHFFTQKIENKIRNTTSPSSITWQQWINNGHRSTKSDVTGTVRQCVTVLGSKVSSFLSHTWIKREQAKHFEFLKGNVSTKMILAQVDYSENFAIGFQDEIQSAHWRKKQLSVFTAHVWLANSESESFTFISDDTTHNKYTVHACLERLLSVLQRSVPDLQEVHFFSDGAASQFKQLGISSRLTMGRAWWMVWEPPSSDSSISKSSPAKTADFVRLARSKTDAVTVEELLVGEVEAAREELHEIFMNTRNVPGVQKIHSIDTMGVDVIQYRSYSTSKEEIIFRF
ncbi:unnamed protein product [Adineta ricciae]|uniref:Uncharacterized protein n=1 Tax=Adineta ricciae TaxID=249248 RepID=A0A814KC16_ADIRI|nr:unnamed protein product [Adineta ricciae]CAF1457676.1 unnamed protein product [Adineta ricciae]